MNASRIETTSWMKAAYLLAIGGHRLAYRVRRPLFILVGVIFYDTVWVFTTT